MYTGLTSDKLKACRASYDTYKYVCLAKVGKAVPAPPAPPERGSFFFLPFAHVRGGGWGVWALGARASLRRQARHRRPGPRRV